MYRVASEIVTSHEYQQSDEHQQFEDRPRDQSLSVASNDAANLTVQHPRLKKAFRCLLEAVEYARDLERDAWDFAVELLTLHRYGLNNNDCRWLEWKGLVEHAREMTPDNGTSRTFWHCGHQPIGKRSCFVLTPAGISVAKELKVRSLLNPDGFNSEVYRSSNGRRQSLCPVWDRDRQELRVHDLVVKQFKVRAENQEAILAAFQEEQWPPRIDDPLPPRDAQEPKRRLHDTINSLNRKQKHPLIRFLGDGSGEGVRWELSSRLLSSGTKYPD